MESKIKLYLQQSLNWEQFSEIAVNLQHNCITFNITVYILTFSSNLNLVKLRLLPITNYSKAYFKLKSNLRSWYLDSALPPVVDM